MTNEISYGDRTLSFLVPVSFLKLTVDTCIGRTAKQLLIDYCYFPFLRFHFFRHFATNAFSTHIATHNTNSLRDTLSLADSIRTKFLAERYEQEVYGYTSVPADKVANEGDLQIAAGRYIRKVRSAPGSLYARVRYVVVLIASNLERDSNWQGGLTESDRTVFARCIQYYVLNSDISNTKRSTSLKSGSHTVTVGLQFVAKMSLSSFQASYALAIVCPQQDSLKTTSALAGYTSRHCDVSLMEAFAIATVSQALQIPVNQ